MKNDRRVIPATAPGLARVVAASRVFYNTKLMRVLGDDCHVAAWLVVVCDRCRIYAVIDLRLWCCQVPLLIALAILGMLPATILRFRR